MLKGNLGRLFCKWNFPWSVTTLHDPIGGGKKVIFKSQEKIQILNYNLYLLIH